MLRKFVTDSVKNWVFSVRHIHYLTVSPLLYSNLFCNIFVLVDGIQVRLSRAQRAYKWVVRLGYLLLLFWRTQVTHN